MTVYELGFSSILDNLDADANGEIQEIRNFTVLDNTDVLQRTDTFEFIVDTSLGNSYIHLYLHNLGGDADVTLFQDENNNGLFESGVDTFLANNIRLDDTSEAVAFYYPGNIGGGTFIPLIAEVRNFDDATVSYDLDIVAVHTGPGQSMFPLSLSEASPINLSGTVKGTSGSFRRGETATTYAIEAATAGTVSVQVAPNALFANPIIRAYGDSNENGIFDSDDVLGAESTNGLLTFDVANPGLGFLQIARSASEPNGFNYDLSVSLDVPYGGRVDEALDFEPLQYVASYGDLIAAFGLDAVAATNHYEQFGLVEERSSDVFDEVRYLASNGDLIAAFGPNYAAATEHYISFGAAEGRSLDAFDPVDYLNNNADLQAAFGNNLFAAAQHYIQFGFNEGRATGGSSSYDGRLDEILGFDPLQYVASYGDLIAAFGLNTAAAANHYEQFGLLEERLADVFDEVRYVASNGDLITAFGTDYDAATAHYISFGAAEGRSTDSFNPESYLSNNADLQAAFGNNLFAATQHYIQFGFAEGRAV